MNDGLRMDGELSIRQRMAGLLPGSDTPIVPKNSIAGRALVAVVAIMTFLASLMVGAGVGAGIMAVPWLAARVGLLGLLVILPIAWAASALVHLMLAEVAFRTGRELQVVPTCVSFDGVNPPDVLGVVAASAAACA